MTDQQQAQRGREAAQILESVVFNDSMTQLKSSVIEQWKACPVRDREGQLLLLQLAKLTDLFEGIIRGAVENGKLAERKIELDALRNESKTQRMFRKVVG